VGGGFRAPGARFKSPPPFLVGARRRAGSCRGIMLVMEDGLVAMACHYRLNLAGRQERLTIRLSLLQLAVDR